MKNFVDVLNACQAAGGAGKKAAIQAALSLCDADTRALMWHAMNPYLTYGVRKWNQPASHQPAGYAGVGHFLDLLQALSSRTLTGNSAQEAVTNTLALYPKEVAEKLELVLEKDLKAGFSEDTYNLVLLAVGEGDTSETNIKRIKKLLDNGSKDAFKNNPNYADLVPTFEVMLADKCEEPEEFLERLKFPAQADFKYDGQRNIAFVCAGKPVENRARSGKLSEHLENLFDDEAEKLRQHLLETYGPEWNDIVIDGEAFAQDFTQTINAKKDGNDEAKAAMKLRVFFVMPLSHWKAQQTNITMRENRLRLRKALGAIDSTKLLLSQGREVSDYEDMVAYCNEVIDTYKQEGLIVKNWDAVYQWDRTIDWCKVKRFYDVDARVTGFYMGRKKSRLEKTVGGLVVEGRDEQGKPFRTKVGSGFSDKDRDHIRDNWHLYDGSTAVITYQEMSLAKGETIYALRFPTIKQLLRDDKVVQPLDI